MSRIRSIAPNALREAPKNLRRLSICNKVIAVALLSLNFTAIYFTFCKVTAHSYCEWKDNETIHSNLKGIEALIEFSRVFWNWLGF